MYRHILVATDFSADCERATALALELAKEDAEWTLLHVVPPSERRRFDFSSAPQDQALAGLLDDEVGSSMVKLDTWANHVGLPESARLVRAGTAGPTIVRVAAENHSDLIVVGACGHAAQQHLYAGSSARTVVRTAPCSVLVGRSMNPPVGRVIELFALALDLRLPSPKALALGQALARRGRGVAWFAWDRDDWTASEFSDEASVKDALQRTLDTYGAIDLRAEVLPGPARDSIKAAVMRERPSLLVMGTKGGRTEAGVDLGSLAADMADQSSCSVLVVRG